MIRGWWWKFLGAGLIICSIVAGLLVPLRPDIADVNPMQVDAGQSVTLQLTGYNTEFTAPGKIRAWLKDNDDYLLPATQVKTLGPTFLELVFDIPQFLVSEGEVGPCTIIVDHPVDGAMIMSNAVFIRQDSVSKSAGLLFWKKDLLKDMNVNEKFSFPNQQILYESIRNLFYHVPMWFAMIIILGIAVYWSIRYLLNPQNTSFDHKAMAYTDVGILLGVLGTLTGALWAKFAWGSYWSWDIKQTVTAVALLLYMAYFILRNAIEDEDRRGRVSAVYNIFAYVAMIPLIFVVPRVMDSLHPGNGGNPGLGVDDLDNTMRVVFYPAIVGWILVSAWIANVRFRILDLKHQLIFKN